MTHNYNTTFEDIKLIPMSEMDSEKYRILRNKPETRCWFEHNSVISAEQQKDWYMKYLKSFDQIMFSAYSTRDGYFIGCNSLYNIDMENKIAEYGRIVVDECYSGKGYGRKMTWAAMKIAREQLLLKNVYLMVYENNIRAISTYQNVGFSKVGKLLDTVGKTMIRMQLEL